jgi:formylglycine-generating enzyme required for sulfatase activity
MVYGSLAGMTQRWQAAGWLSQNGRVRLPSEVEWEKAARGGVQIPVTPVVCAVSQVQAEWQVDLTGNVGAKRPYPWGDDDPANHANYQVHGWGSTGAVACFPGSASPNGCVDMSGNGREWTRSHFEPYPYDAGDGRENKDVKLFHKIVLRGGAFWVDAQRIRCSSRVRRAPNGRDNHYTFRIVVKIGD